MIKRQTECLLCLICSKNRNQNEGLSTYRHHGQEIPALFPHCLQYSTLQFTQHLAVAKQTVICQKL